MVANGECQFGVITSNDSDALFYPGAKNLIYYAKFLVPHDIGKHALRRESLYGVLVESQSVLFALHTCDGKVCDLSSYDDSLLLLLAVLRGCDYHKVTGIGWKKALESVDIVRNAMERGQLLFECLNDIKLHYKIRQQREKFIEAFLAFAVHPVCQFVEMEGFILRPYKMANDFLLGHPVTTLLATLPPENSLCKGVEASGSTWSFGVTSYRHLGCCADEGSIDPGRQPVVVPPLTAFRKTSTVPLETLPAMDMATALGASSVQSVAQGGFERACAELAEGGTSNLCYFFPAKRLFSS